MDKLEIRLEIAKVAISSNLTTEQAEEWYNWVNETEESKFKVGGKTFDIDELAGKILLDERIRIKHPHKCAETLILGPKIISYSTALDMSRLFIHRNVSCPGEKILDHLKKGEIQGEYDSKRFTNKRHKFDLRSYLGFLYSKYGLQTKIPEIKELILLMAYNASVTPDRS